MPRTVTPTQYRRLVYNTAANLGLSFTQTQDSIAIPSHLQNTRSVARRTQGLTTVLLSWRHFSRRVFTGHDMHPLLDKFTPLPKYESLKLYDTEYRNNSQCSSQVWQSFISQMTETLVVKDIPSFHGSHSFYCRVRKDPALYHIRARSSTLFLRYISRVFNKTGSLLITIRCDRVMLYLLGYSNGFYRFIRTQLFYGDLISPVNIKRT